MFADVSKEALTKRRILVNIESLVFVIELLISFINCAPEVASSISKQGAVKKKKKCIFVSISRPQQQNGFAVSWLLCFNLCSRKWLRTRRCLVRYLIPLQLWQLKTLFDDGLINFNKFFLKTQSFWKD